LLRRTANPIFSFLLARADEGEGFEKLCAVPLLDAACDIIARQETKPSTPGGAT
jgi:hypothetical protein